MRRTLTRKKSAVNGRRPCEVDRRVHRRTHKTRQRTEREKGRRPEMTCMASNWALWEAPISNASTARLVLPAMAERAHGGELSEISWINAKRTLASQTVTA